MTDYIITATGDTAGIEFNVSKGLFLIAGKSLPEDADLFFDGAIKWVKLYKSSPNPVTKVLCKLEYFNTASSKKIMDLLNEFKQVPGNVSVEWQYMMDDDDMEEIGKEFADLLGIPFSFNMVPSF